MSKYSYCDGLTREIEMNSLNEAPLKPLLARLHKQAARELPRAALGLIRLMAPRLLGRQVTSADHARFGHKLFIALEPEAGHFAYATARAIKARTIVEFGTSFGISTLYLAAAVRDNGGGTVITTELDADKAAVARRYFAEAGLDDLIELRVGDALETLQSLTPQVDMALIDGWKEVYGEVLTLIEPALRPGAVVLADNVTMFKRTLAPYVQRMQQGGNYSSQTLPLGSGLEYSVRL
jgi:predicted O-methyltransferase YrrM